MAKKTNKSGTITTKPSKPINPLKPSGWPGNIRHPKHGYVISRGLIKRMWEDTQAVLTNGPGKLSQEEMIHLQGGSQALGMILDHGRQVGNFAHRLRLDANRIAQAHTPVTPRGMQTGPLCDCGACKLARRLALEDVGDANA